jgi:hypothetical protein
MSLSLPLAIGLLVAAIDPGLSLIEQDATSGAISEDEAAVQRFYRLFRPDDGAQRYNPGPWQGQARCGTSVLADVQARWDELSGSVKHDVAQATDPFYRAWLRDGGISWEQGDVRTAQLQQRTTCFDPEDLDGFGAYARQTTSPDDWVTIHWNPEGLVNDQRVDWMAGWFDDAFAIEVDDLGFFAPEQITSHELLVIVEDIQSESIFGYTGRAVCGFNGAMSYIVMNSRFVDDMVTLRPTAAHELFHAIQAVYGFQEFWSRESLNRWWLEGSAVYAASIVFPGDQARHAGHAYSYSVQPHVSLLTHQGRDGLFQYGTSTWAMSIGTSLGDPVWHRDFWEQLRGRDGYALVDEFDDYLQTRDTSFLEEYHRFISRGATGDWNDNPFLAAPWDFESTSAVTAEHGGDDFPLDERVDSDSGLDRPEYLGTNFVVFESSGVERNTGLVVEFWGNADKNDVDVEWAVELVATDDGRPIGTHRLEIEFDGDEWHGRILLNRFARNYDRLVLAISPVTDFGEGGITWRYAATLIESEQDEGFSEVPTREFPVDEGDACEGCEASAVGTSSAGGAALLIAFCGALRRRRSSFS